MTNHVKYTNYYEGIREMEKHFEPIKSTGWATDYYNIPKHVRDVDDLITYFKLNWHMANILKACIRYGRKEGVSKEYDLNKILFMAEREKKGLTEDI